MCVVIASRALACTAALAACGDPPARVRLVPVAFATGCGRPALSPPVMRVIAYGSGPDSKRSADAPIGDFPADTEQLGVEVLDGMGAAVAIGKTAPLAFAA